MFKVLATQLLQHLLAQNSWAGPILKPFAGKSIAMHIGPMHTALVILENGSLALAGASNVADATVSIAPSLLLRLLAKDEAAKLQIEVSGDTHLATELAKVLSNMRWDYEDDLSKLVGDVPALKAGQLGRAAANTLKDSSRNLADMLSEYWQEEKPLLAKKRHVDAFNSEVDTLRNDVERLEKRLGKLTQQMTASQQPTPTTHSHK